MFPGVFLIIAILVYGTDVKNVQNFDVDDISAGFAMMVVAAALLLAVGVLACFIK